MSNIATVVNLRKSSYDVYIGRPSIYGNPVIIGKKCQYCDIVHSDAGSTLQCYRDYFYSKIENDENFRKSLEDIKGKTLGCFCKPKPCHGDIICEYLNKQ
jgi:hypothetical protein